MTKRFLALLFAVAAVGFAIQHSDARIQRIPVPLSGKSAVVPPPVTGGSLVLEDGTSFLLLEDGASQLCLEGGC